MHNVIMRNRIFSLFLFVVMLAGMLPTTVLAADAITEVELDPLRAHNR